jgi:hypothetical protein
MLAGPAYAQVPDIPGDLNDDGFVGIEDLNLVYGNWNQTVPPADPRADVAGGGPTGDDPDGTVGIADLNAVLGNWNAGDRPRQPFKGMNLSESRYWSREWNFVDIMKRAREWTYAGPNSLVTDTNGWPILEIGDTVTTNLVSNVPGFPSGAYVCTFDGTGGTLQFSGHVQNVQTSAGQVTFDVINTTGTNISINLKITGTNPSDPIKNIKVWMPGFDENSPSPFHPLFIKRLRPFSVIRFMDWQRLNELDDVDWAQRTTPSYYSQSTKTRRGISLEHMIELSNELQVDPWFCMPHKASEAYVTAFATMVLNDLNPNSKVYVEWSNEVWNAGLGEVYEWIKLTAVPNPPQDLGADEFYDVWADETAKDFKIWYDIFAAANQEHRLIRVAAGQAANVDVTEKLTRRLKNRADFAEQFDAISVSTYFGDDDASFNDNTTLAEVLTDMKVRAVDESTGYYQVHGLVPGGLAQDLSGPGPFGMDRPIKYIAYEGGQHYIFKHSNGSILQAIKDAQVDPEIYDAYIANLAAFSNAGGSLTVMFSNVNNQNDDNGAWGHLANQDQPLEDAHKMRAVLDFNP